MFQMLHIAANLFVSHCLHEAQIS